MPNVYKSFSVEVLDNFFAPEGDLNAAYEYSLDLLNDESRSLAEITEQLGQDNRGMEAVADQADYFRTTWLEGAMGEKHVDAIMRRAYKHAIGLATEGDEPKPIDTFWITGTGNDFEMHVCDTSRQVTVFLIVPIPRPEPGSRNAVSQSWAIRAGHGGVVTIEKVSGRDPAD